MDFIVVNTPLIAALAMMAGFVLLIKGGDWTVDSAVFVANKFGISPLMVGFTIVAFGTSLPELIVSVLANIDGSPGIALGNVLGSNIANILCVLGVTAIVAPLVFNPKITNPKAVQKDLLFMLLSTALLAGLLIYGTISALAGGIMIALLVVYVFLKYRMAVKGETEVEAEAPEEDFPAFKSQVMPYVVLLAGLVSVAVGAEFLVKGAKFSATYIGVPEAVIALSIIALGTSLPELSTCIISARKGHSGMALGNIVGSNVFNILMIIGLTALIKPIPAGSYAAQIVDFDIWVTFAVSLIFAILLLLYKKITRPMGLVFVAAYVVYNVYIYAVHYIGA